MKPYKSDKLFTLEYIFQPRYDYVDVTVIILMSALNTAGFWAIGISLWLLWCAVSYRIQRKLGLM